MHQRIVSSLVQNISLSLLKGKASSPACGGAGGCHCLGRLQHTKSGRRRLGRRNVKDYHRLSAAEINFPQKGPEQLAKPPPALRLKYTPVLHTKHGLAGLDLELIRKKVAASFVLIYCHCPGHRVWEKQSSPWGRVHLVCKSL